MRLSGNADWSFYPYSKWPFIENVNRRIWLPMWREREDLIAPSECSLRTWLDLEPLLMFFICVVTTFLLTEISLGSFHVHRSLEIHAPVTPSDCWLHCANSKKNLLTEFIMFRLKKEYIIYFLISGFCGSLFFYNTNFITLTCFCF